MSGRPTAEIVADLRTEVVEYPLTHESFLVEAADRLTELDAEIESLRATSGRSGVA